MSPHCPHLLPGPHQTFAQVLCPARHTSPLRLRQPGPLVAQPGLTPAASRLGLQGEIPPRQGWCFPGDSCLTRSNSENRSSFPSSSRYSCLAHLGQMGLSSFPVLGDTTESRDPRSGCTPHLCGMWSFPEPTEEKSAFTAGAQSSLY